jgi:CubicO group peptidase (beta-lactamase class C family)
MRSALPAGEPGTFEGFADPRFAQVAQCFSGLFGSSRGGGGALVIRWRGETVLDVWKGFADPHGRTPWTHDTLALGFSATKGIASTVIHRLADRGLLAYDEPVATYWPSFAANGKARITIRDVMSHRAGLYSTRAIAHHHHELLDHLEMEHRLAAVTPEPGPCQPAYHALTYGWLLAGIARRLTGKGMAELVREELGIDGMQIGVTPDDQVEMSELIGNQPQVMSRLCALAPITSRIAPTRRLSDALAIPGFFSALAGPRPRILGTEMPSGNGVFTAAALATHYGALANNGAVDGRQLLSPDTVRQLSQVQTEARDRGMGLRVRWRLGYHQAVSFGAASPTAFGHYGYGGSGGWADPTSGLSLGFVTNKIGWQTTPIGDARLFRLTGLALNAAKQPGTGQPTAAK